MSASEGGKRKGRGENRSTRGQRPAEADVNALIALFRANRLNEARSRAREFVRTWPDLGIGWNVLAASLQALGSLEEAADAYRRAVGIEPGNHDARNNLGNVLHELGRYDEAVESLTRAIELNPGLLAAHYNLGLALSALGRHRDAEAAFARVVRLRPDLVDAHNHVGNQLKAQDRLEEAVEAYRRALAVSPGHAAVLSNLALVQAALGLPDDAERSWRQALETDPEAPDILSNLGTFLMGRGRPAEAESCFRAALEAHAAAAPELLNNLGVALQQMGRLAEAKAVFQNAIDSAPDSPSAWHNLGNVEMDLGRLEEAEHCHRRVTALDPESAVAHRHLGVTLAVLGRRDEAEASYRRALAIQPERAEVWYRLAEIGAFGKKGSDIERIEALLERGDLEPGDRVHLHYAAGKAYADAGADTESSFQHYLDGAAVQRSRIHYDVSGDETRFERIAEAFPAEVVERFGAAGCDSDVPVFVVGMPRSGTTLVESILARHPDVHGAGERFDLDRLTDEMNRARGRDFPDWIPDLDDAGLRDLGRRYAQGLSETAPDAARVVDKMPNNFQYLGLIAGLLPRAHVIHVHRDPLDTCFSCFTHIFENEQLFSWELEELGRYYRAYSRLMAHWKRVLRGDFLISVRYEDLVRDPEPSVRAMLAHCRLQWNPACLQPHLGSRAVTTASLAQVRQPIYRSAIGRWKPYARQLRPLVDALGDLAKA
ncbi:MAG: tetratricopeptide repeat protein [Gammaproteobacteria bacterium]|nr:tetratricopeptide repeat protein [Gammaproteobacteria bacterium]